MSEKMNSKEVAAQRDALVQRYRAAWEKKTTKQIRKECKSWRKYMQKHSSAYGWHDQPPSALCDSDHLLILLDILKDRGESEYEER